MGDTQTKDAEIIDVETKTANQLTDEETKVPTIAAPLPTIARQEDWQFLKEQCAVFVKSNLLPKGMTVAGAITIAAYGKEIGVPPMTALQQIYIVDGKPSMGSRLMLARFYEFYPKAYFKLVESTTEKAVIKIEKHGIKEEATPHEFTLEEAKNAHLYPRKDNWKNYPKDMLFNRVVARAIRIEAPEVLGPMLYTPEELGADTDRHGTPNNPYTGENPNTQFINETLKSEKKVGSN